MRDPTIGSIFEEVIAKRIRAGHIKPLSSDINFRKTQAHENPLKIIVINPDPEKLLRNMEKLHYVNLSQTFIPIQVEFPKVNDDNFDEMYLKVLSQLKDDLIQINYFPESNIRGINNVLNDRYGISI